MSSFIDEEFGAVTLRRSAKASHIRIRVSPDGRLRASLPMYAPLFMVKRLVKSSRAQLREMLDEHRLGATYSDAMQIGKSHSLSVLQVSATQPIVKRHGLRIIVSLPATKSIADTDIQRRISDEVIKALRLEAKSYLPKRLAFLAQKHGYGYQKVKFTHAGSRWGSCNTNGVISLNIALMKLPFELIDYVLIHELCHTVQMNHSDNFWQLVYSGDPEYLLHRRVLKGQTPSL